MDISKTIINLANGGLFLDTDFINSQSNISAPFLDQMKFFLNQIKEEGIKLTKTGNIPTALVKEFIYSVDSKSIGSSGLRYTENDFISIQRVKIVSLTIKFTVKKNNTLYLTKEGKLFLKQTQAHQLLYLLEKYSSTFNIGYFDRYEKAQFAQSLSLDLLSIVALHGEFLDFKEYIDSVRMHSSGIDELIEQDIVPTPYQKSKLEAFYAIAHHRIFRQFFIPFGLVENDENNYKASTLLHSMIIKQTKNTNPSLEKLSGNKIKETKQLFLDLGYDVNLFYEFFHLSTKLASQREVTFETISNEVSIRCNVKEKDQHNFMIIHTGFYMMIGYFYNWLLAEERADEPENVIQDVMQSLSSALYHQIPLSLLPLPVMNAVENSILFSMFDLLDSYGINPDSKGFILEIKEKMNPFIFDKVEHFFQVLMICKNEAKTSKRITKQLTNDIKMLIMNFIVVCWDVMIYREE